MQMTAYGFNGDRSKAIVYTADEVDELLDGISPEIPVASDQVAGIVKVGTGLAIDAEGVLSLNVPNGDTVGY